ncbi:hypothetical protein N1851_018425 [Merluccius polli]|uniref:Protein shortage in chiasmata 1 ortholog n=1 Tax=Merluccius polli TaxID=89951 RepID=A0AA47P005_MERPO|nr:hypothetical protein N1851_018425 [Merluccius polli]
MDCLALPTLYDISSDVYPHTGNLTGDAYRRPWVRGSVISTCTLFANGSILDDLRGKQPPVHLLLERLGHKGDHVILSSNPNSQEDLDQDEVARLLQESSAYLPSQECFYKSATDQMSQNPNNTKDLLLEEVVDPLPVLKRHLPTLKAKLSRLRSLPVADPLLNTNSLSEELILRHCAVYEVPPQVDTKDFTTSSHIHEEFNTEDVLNHESLLLPVVLETLSLNRENYNSLQSIEKVLNVALEPLEHQLSTLDVLREANPQAQLAVDISQFDPPKEMASDVKIDGGPLDPAGHMLLSIELELDLPLTPPTKAGPTLFGLSNSQLPLEELSPVHRPSLVSQSDQQEMELAVWKAEKHLHSVLGFLLTEPQTQDPVVVFHPVSDALKELNEETCVGVHAGSVVNDLQSQMPSVTAVCFSFCEFTENLTPGSPGAKEHNMEDFTAMSPEDIECSYSEKLPGSYLAFYYNEIGKPHCTALTVFLFADILTAQEEDSVPIVTINGVKSILKKPVPSDQPVIPMNDDTSTCAVRQNIKFTVVSQGHPSCMDATQEKQQEETSALLPAVSVSNTAAKEPFLVCETTFSDLQDTCSHVTRPASRNESQRRLCTSFRAEHAKSAQLLLRNNERSLVAAKDPDPLSTFMMLRSQQTSTDPVLPQPCPGTTGGPKVQQPTPALPQSQHTPGAHSWPTAMTSVVTGSSTRVREPEAQSPSQTLPGPAVTQDKPECRVIQVQATALPGFPAVSTESVWRANCELLAVAQPCLSRAWELGLSCPAWGDFSSITPDQTRFLLKQQEKELCRLQGEDKELLFNQVALIHVLVTFKDMMLKCDLITAVEYLAQAAVACSGQRLEQLVKRLQLVVYLSHRNQEPNPKILELQDQLVSWLQSRTGHSSSDKVLILTTVDDDNARATLVQALTQATGEAVTAVCPKDGRTKLNGAQVISSVCGIECMVACVQHIGADFPWPCFSLVVEYDHPGHSPWATLCKEKNINHLCFHTSLPPLEVQSASLEENVPFVLLVTEGLLNCPLLLQILETRYSISVLERSYSPALQMLGGTHHYAVVTVDESTAVVIQEQEEMGQAGWCERVVMRLNALSLQYSSCWLILHCPDIQAGGLSSEAFSNLALVYSSLVVFGMKSEDLNVKVLLVSEVGDVARWVCQICFHSLMSSDKEPRVYLNLHWLALMPSQEECCLLLFPCVNPLVGQLMLRRAPSLQWLLGASLSELEELFPDVPHKVLKLFSDTTSLYQLSKEQSSPHIHPPATQTTDSKPRSSWTCGAYTPHPPSPTNRQSEPSTANAIHFLFGDKPIGTSYSEPKPSLAEQDMTADFHVDQSVSFGGSTYLQGAWAGKEPWQDEKEDEEVEEEEEGKPLQSEGDDWIQSVLGNSSLYHPHTTGSSPYHPLTTGSSPYHPLTTGSSPYHPHNTSSSPYHLHTAGFSPYHQHTTGGNESFKQPGSFSSFSTSSQLQLFCDDQPDDGYCVSGARPPAEALVWGRGNVSSSRGRGAVGISPAYGSRCWMMGLERKRSGAVADLGDTVLPPLKRGRLGLEKVPGRSDGQTRLRFL